MEPPSLLLLLISLPCCNTAPSATWHRSLLLPTLDPALPLHLSSAAVGGTAHVPGGRRWVAAMARAQRCFPLDVSGEKES